MMLFLLILIIVFIVMYSQIKTDICETNREYTADSNEVSADYAKEAIKFFNNYLSLCRNHSVMAVCHLQALGTSQFGVETKMECVITAIDGEHADEEFDMVKNIWMNRREEKRGIGDYSAVVSAGDEYIKGYFDCEDLHYVFSEVDEYQFDNGQVIMSFERTMFTQSGAKWQPTLVFIKQELQKNWESATITVDKAGIIVKP